MDTTQSDTADPSGDVATTQLRCAAQTQRGNPCRSFASGGELCLAHDPDRRIAMREARGGAAASKLRALDGRRARLDTPEALLKFSTRLIQDTLDGSVSTDVARTVFRGVAIQRQLVESSDLEKRLSTLEARLDRKGTSRWSV